MAVLYGRAGSAINGPFRRFPTRAVDQNCQSAFIGIMTFYIQTCMLLEIDMGDQVGGAGFLNMELDTPSPSSTETEGSCLSTGRFYVDWAMKFAIPVVMVTLALVLCLATRVKPHERWRTLLLVTQFGLFPTNLNALQMFFCRTPKSFDEDGYVLPQLDYAVLRSDPSIRCWDSEHLPALILSFGIVALCSLLFPIILFRKIRARLAANLESDRLAAMAMPKGLTLKERQLFESAFQKYDDDGSGLIDEDELRALLTEKARLRAPAAVFTKRLLAPAVCVLVAHTLPPPAGRGQAVAEGDHDNAAGVDGWRHARGRPDPARRLHAHDARHEDARCPLASRHAGTRAPVRPCALAPLRAAASQA
jgi:hypothetical protein